MSYDRFKVDIPTGTLGEWTVKQYTIGEEESRFDQIRATLGSGRFTPPGTYTSLWKQNELIMSDTPDEVRDHLEVIRRATGDVLINGLGIGMVLNAILQKPNVISVTVIEISPEVIALVGEHYKKKFGDKLTIINADALTWKPPKGADYDVIWHDIWGDISVKNLPEMHKLHRRYGRFARWQASWCRERCEKEARIEQQRAWLRGSAFLME